MQRISQLNKEGRAEELATRMRELQEELDSNVSRSIQEAQKNLGNLIQIGELDSIESINRAKGEIFDELSNQYTKFVENTYEASKFLLDKAENDLKYYRDSNLFDAEMTTQISDGFLYNKMGEKMLDPVTRQPLRNPTILTQ